MLRPSYLTGIFGQQGYHQNPPDGVPNYEWCDVILDVSVVALHVQKGT